MKKQLLILMALVITSIGYSQSFVQNNITYQVTSTSLNTVKTTDYNAAGGSVVDIPSTVINTSTSISYSVTEIGQNSFSQKNLSSVIIPTTVTVIGAFSFVNNPNLSSAPLHNGIISIGSNAFNNCSLTSVIIPTSMTSIADGTFVNNYITSITIPNNITSIGAYAFRFNRIMNVFIPDSVVSIGEAAFASNNINSVNIPNGITTIPNLLFDTNDLTSFTIPNNITSIGDYAFRANDLTSVIIPNSVTSIGDYAFAYNDLNAITIPNSIVTIGESAFEDNQLTSVTIPNSVTNIGPRAFNLNLLVSVFSERITPPIINTTGDNFDTFSDNRSTIHLHIPAGTLGAYVTNAGALWTGFNPVTEDALSTSNFELENTVKILTTKDALNIISDHSLQLQDYTLYSISGMEITTGKENNISTSIFARGIYMLKLNFDRGTVVKKVIFN